MEDKNISNKPDRRKLDALKNLPENILKSLTQDEIHAFLHEDEWPDSLLEKLRDYVVDDE